MLRNMRTDIANEGGVSNGGIGGDVREDGLDRSVDDPVRQLAEQLDDRGPDA
jgi:hypothetical protein